MKFTHNIKFQPAYDKRSSEPSKNYGTHGVHIWFECISEEIHEGLTFSVSTNWQLPHVQAETDAKPGPEHSLWMFHKPMAFGVDIHTKTPRYAGQSAQQGCGITGGECYCDGSSLLGESFLTTLIEGGDKALFARMEQQFIDWTSK